MSQPQLDRADARVTHATGLSGTVRAFIDRVKAGDLGSLPVVVGLAIIWTVFTALNLILGYCFFRFVLFRGQRT